jgi:hypothetical protein
MSHMISHHGSRPVPRIASRAGTLAVLALVLMLAGCYYYDPYSGYSLSVTSPTTSVYTSAPQLNYTAGRDVSVTLNGTLVTTASGGTLNGAVTGLNELVVTELSSSGGTVTSSTITFFLNDLPLSDSWNCSDTTGWTNLTSGVTLVVDDTLGAKDAATSSSWGTAYKTYNPVTEKECIQAQDVMLIDNNNSYASVGFLGSTSGDSLAARLVKVSSTSYTLDVTEESATLLASPYFLKLGSATLDPVTSGTAIRVYLYRNDKAYQAIAADANGAILAGVDVGTYSSAIGDAGQLVKRGIVLLPYLTATSTTPVVKVDNYAYYK